MTWYGDTRVQNTNTYIINIRRNRKKSRFRSLLNCSLNYKHDGLKTIEIRENVLKVL